MAQTNINIRMDENLKRDFDALCGDLGLTIPDGTCRESGCILV